MVAVAGFGAVVAAGNLTIHAGDQHTFSRAGAFVRHRLRRISHLIHEFRHPGDFDIVSEPHGTNCSIVDRK